MQVADDTGVHRHDVHLLADTRAPLAVRQIDEGVLLVELVDVRARILADVAVAIIHAVRSQGLAAAVEDGALWRGAADDRNLHAHGAVVQRRPAALHGVHVVENVGAHAQFRQLGQLVRGLRGAGAAPADLRHLDAGAGEALQCVLQARADDRVGRVDEEAGELQVRPGDDLLRQRNDLLRRCAGALDFGLQVRHDADADALCRGGGLQAIQHLAVVGAYRDAAAARQPGEARGLLRPDDVVGQLDVIKAGVEKDLDLAQLLAGDADGAGLLLNAGDFRALVRLDVRPKGQAVAVAVSLHARDVAFHAREVDEDGGRVEVTGVGHGAGSPFGRERRFTRLTLAAEYSAVRPGTPESFWSDYCPDPCVWRFPVRPGSFPGRRDDTWHPLATSPAVRLFHL